MPLSPSERGRLGGQATALKHGSPHMSAIGYGGMLMVAARYFGGDVAGMMQYVRNFKRNPDQPKAKPFHTAA